MCVGSFNLRGSPKWGMSVFVTVGAAQSESFDQQ